MRTFLLTRLAPALVTLWVLTLLVLTSAASAQGVDEAPTVNEVASELYCPLCTGMSVDVCPLEVCIDMRRIIAERLEAGEEPEQIKRYFVEQYGQKVLGRPSTEGFHLAAWLIPFVVLVGALGTTAAWLRSRPAARADPRATVPPPKHDDDGDPYSARLERELQRLDE